MSSDAGGGGGGVFAPLASGANTAPPPPPASDDDEEEYSDDDDADDDSNEPDDDFGPLQSSFYGVAWDRKKGRWRAAVRLAKRLGYEGQVYNIGMFDEEKQAARAVDAFVRRYMPELVHSHLNFPDEADEDAGRDSPADAIQDAPNEPECAADASEAPLPAPAPAVPPADQTGTASDSAMDLPPPPAPMESDEDQDNESVPEIPGTTI